MSTFSSVLIHGKNTNRSTTRGTVFFTFNRQTSQARSASHLLMPHQLATATSIARQTLLVRKQYDSHGHFIPKMYWDGAIRRDLTGPRYPSQGRYQVLVTIFALLRQNRVAMESLGTAANKILPVYRAWTTPQSAESGGKGQEGRTSYYVILRSIIAIAVTH